MCTRGKGCTYAHGPEELQPLPNLYKTKMCFELSKNKKCHNPSCQYAHTKSELRNIAYENHQEDEDVDQQGFSSPTFFVPNMATLWFPVVHLGSPGSPLPRGASKPMGFGAESPTMMQLPDSPFFCGPMPSKEDNWSLCDSPSRQTTSTTADSQSSEESDSSEPDSFQVSPAVTWTVKNTFLELSSATGAGEEFVASRMFRSSSSPVFI